MQRATSNVMRFNSATRAIAALLLVVVAIASVLVAFLHGSQDLPLLQVFLTIVFLMLVAAAVEVFGVAHRLVPGGIERVTPWRQRIIVRWAEVIAIEWSPNVRWYELRSIHGDRIRIPQQLTAIDAFARAALEGIPAHVLDGRAGLRQQLENATHGVEPPNESGREESNG